MEIKSAAMRGIALAKFTVCFLVLIASMLGFMNSAHAQVTANPDQTTCEAQLDSLARGSDLDEQMFAQCASVFQEIVNCWRAARGRRDARNAAEIIRTCRANQGGGNNTPPRRVEVTCPPRSHLVGDRFTGTCDCDSGWQAETTTAWVDRRRVRLTACIPGTTRPGTELAREQVCTAVVHDENETEVNTTCSNAISILDRRVGRVEVRQDQTCRHERADGTVSYDCVEFNTIVMQTRETANGTRRDLDEHVNHPHPSGNVTNVTNNVTNNGRMVYFQGGARGFGLFRFNGAAPQAGGLLFDVAARFQIPSSIVSLSPRLLVGFAGSGNNVGITWALGGELDLDLRLLGTETSAETFSLVFGAQVLGLTTSGDQCQGGLCNEYRGVGITGQVGVRGRIANHFLLFGQGGFGWGDAPWNHNGQLTWYRGPVATLTGGLAVEF